MKCSLLRERIDTYLDGEASPSTCIVFEDHLQKCRACRELVEAFSVQTRCVKRAFKDVGMSAEAKERLQQEILEEAKRLDAEKDADRPLIRWVPMPWKYVAPAAVLGIVLFSVLRFADDSMSQKVSAGALGLYGEVQQLHARQLPMDIEDAEALPTYFQDKVPVPVYPVIFQNTGIRFSGARFAQIQQKPVATLYYVSGHRRIMVVVSESYPDTWRQGDKVNFGGREIYYYRIAGRTISAFEDNGVLYTFAGDLPPHQMLRLVASMSVK